MENRCEPRGPVTVLRWQGQAGRAAPAQPAASAPLSVCLNRQLPVQVNPYFYILFVRDTRHGLVVLLLLSFGSGLNSSWMEGIKFIVMFCLQYY